MTLTEAFQQLLDSIEFKEIAKQKTTEGNRYRVSLMRFRNKELGSGAMCDMLLKHGYEIKANKARKLLNNNPEKPKEKAVKKKK